MDEWDKDLLDLRLAEQAIAKESLEAKKIRIQELETEVRYLRRLLNELLAVPRPQSSPVPSPASPGTSPEIPRRWRMRSL